LLGWTGLSSLFVQLLSYGLFESSYCRSELASPTVAFS